MTGCRWLLAALVSACLALGPGAGPVPDFTFIHCTDLHAPAGESFRRGPPGGPQFGSAEVVAQIKTLTAPLRLPSYGITVPAPEFAIATGDLTEFGGLNGWWDQYLQLWQRAPFPVYHESGNHDATWACQRFRIRQLHGQAYYSFDRDGCHFIGLDSATPQDPRPSFGEEELLWLRHDLARVAPETPLFIYCHHPIDSSEFASLYERDRLLDLLRPYNVALLLVGHGHAVEHRVVAGVDQVMGGSTFGVAPGHAVVSVKDGILRVAYRRAAEPEPSQPVLEKPLPHHPNYPHVTIESPREREALTRSGLLISARIDRDDVSSVGWQADDQEDRRGTLRPSDYRVRQQRPGWLWGTFTRGWEPGAHFLRVVFHTDGGDFQRSVSFTTAGGAVQARWRAYLEGSSKATPAVEGDTVYVGADDGGLYALDRRSGRRRWRFMTGGEVLTGPLARDGVVYFGSGDGHFYAVDRRGRERWRFEAGGPVYSSPIWTDGMLLFGANDARFYALDAETGRPRWTSDAPGYAIESRPFVAGDTVYFGAWDTFLYALDLKDGHLKWRTEGAGSAASTPGAARYYSPADAAPVVAGGKVYVADRAYMLTILDAATGAVLGTRRGVSAVGLAKDGKAVYLRGTDGDLRKIDLAGCELWSRPAYTGYVPTAPVEVDGVVYSAGGTGRVVALDSVDGRHIWEYQATPRLYLLSDVAAADGTAYVGGMDGSVTALTGGGASRD